MRADLPEDQGHAVRVDHREAFRVGERGHARGRLLLQAGAREAVVVEDQRHVDGADRGLWNVEVGLARLAAELEDDLLGAAALRRSRGGCRRVERVGVGERSVDQGVWTTRQVHRRAEGHEGHEDGAKHHGERRGAGSLGVLCGRVVRRVVRPWRLVRWRNLDGFCLAGEAE